jgi:YD repeat-containing protein
LNPGIESPGSQYITSLSYNQAAQLAAVNAGSSALASYTYDGFGQRLLKTISSTDGNIYQYAAGQETRSFDQDYRLTNVTVSSIFCVKNSADASISLRGNR